MVAICFYMMICLYKLFDMCSLLHQIIIIDIRILLEESFYFRWSYYIDMIGCFLYDLRDSTQCILIHISISCYHFFVVYLFVDVKINLIQCECQCQYIILLFLPKKNNVVFDVGNTDY